MAEQIISASGTQYGLVINNDGSIPISGTVTVTNITGSIVIGSVSAHVDSIYVQSGDNINISSMPKTEVYGSGLFPVSGAYFPGSVYQATDPWIVLGSAQVTNFSDLGSTVVIDSPATIGSLAIQTVDGSINVSTDPVPVSGNYFPGSNVLLESLPTDTNVINSYITLVYVSSGTGTGISTGSVIGSIIQFIGAGSYVKSLTYSNNNLVNIGSWT